MIASLFSGILGNKYVLGALVVLTLLSGAYIYYLRTSAQIERLTNDNKQLELENESLKASKARLEADAKKIIKSNEDLAKEVSKTRKEADEIKETIYRENKKKKSLEELAIKKTSLIEKLVNKGTKEVFDCFELLSRGGDC